MKAATFNITILMLEKFLDYIKEHRLFSENDKILLGISGGIDSMVMLELFIRSGFKTGVAHCNFGLRGNESDEDQQFVKENAELHHLPFYTINFDTKHYAGENKLSIQMAARELRFNWFRKVKAEEDYQYIALAHHMDDMVETFFINLSRGTGIRGLTGIRPRNSDIVRPLLFATRDEIITFSSENGIRFREDSSNNELKYTRNIIRHKILPEFQKLNPGFNRTMIENIERTGEAARLYQEEIKSLKKQLIKQKNNTFFIEIPQLQSMQISAELLFDILEDFHFNYEVVREILSASSSQSGKQFFSDTHRLVKDRTRLYISVSENRNYSEYYIRENELPPSLPFPLSMKEMDYSNDFDIHRGKNVATVDKNKLRYPLTVRRWKSGDYFYPFGMQQKKKLSDFFIDNKFSILEKENTWLLCSGNDIIWVMGHRPDNRFRVTEQTKKAVIFEMNLPTPADLK